MQLSKITQPFSILGSIEGCALWLAADKGVTTVDGNVSSWADQSGNGRHVSQSTVGSRPAYVASAQGGRPTVRCASGKTLTNTAISGLDGMTGFTKFMVIKSSDYAALSYSVFQLRAGTIQVFGSTFYRVTTNNYWIRAGVDATDRYGYALSIATNDNPMIVTDTYNGAGTLNSDKLRTYKNSTSVTLSYPGGSIPTSLATGATFLEVGITSGSSYDISECILFNRALTSYERQRIEQYLSQKYAIEVTKGPENIPDCALWLDAEKGVTTVDGYVSSWADQSGNGRHATQDTVGSRPLYVASGQGSKPTIRFDGSDDTLSITLANSITSNDLSFFAVAKHISDGYSATPVLYMYNATNTSVGFGLISGRVKIGGRRVSGDTFTLSDGTRADSTNALVITGSINYSSGALSGRRNGVLDTTGTLPSTGSPASLVSATLQGNGTFSNADISEIIIFSRALDSYERKAIEDYLSAKYSITTVTGRGPYQIPDCSLWLDASSGVNTVDGYVSAWNDRSGSGNNASQDTVASRPLYVASGQGSKPTVRFDGSDDSLSLSTFVGLPTGNGARSAFVVIKQNSTANHKCVFWMGTASSALCWDIYMPSTGYVAQDINSAGILSNAVIQDTSPAIYEIHHPGIVTLSYGSLYKNGVKIAATLSGADYTLNTTYGAAYVGSGPGAASFNGDISEILVFSRALSSSERQKIEQYLSDKYAITTTSGPENVPDCCLWLDASSGVTTVDGNVSAWNDRSGNGNHASQSTVGSRPLYVASAQGGRPTLRFTDSSSHYMQTSSHVDLPADCTFFAVYQTGNSFLSQYRILYSDDNFPSETAQFFIFAGRYTTGLINSGHAIAGQGSRTIYSTSGVINNSSYIVSTTRSDGTSASTGKVYLNGINVSGAMSGGALSVPSSSFGTSTIGRSGNNPSYYFQGDISEIIIFNRALSDTERVRVERYLSRKYEVGLPNRGPRNVPGCQLWLDAGVGVTTVDGNVSSWADQSGNGNHAVQSTVSDRPTYITSAQGSRPTLRFDGLSDFLNITNLANIPSGSQGRTAFVVAKRSNNSNRHILFAFLPETATNGSSWVMNLGINAPYTEYYMSYWGYRSIVNGATSDTNSNIFSAILNGSLASNTTSYKNGTVLANPIVNEGTVDTVPTYGYVGAQIYTSALYGSFNGDISEIIIYDRALTNNERMVVEEYLSVKYSINLS